jgi:hypothetical protein
MLQIQRSKAVTVEIFLASPAEIRRSISSWVTSTDPRIQNKAEHRGKYAV